jgi:hypothetical protein
MNAIICPFDQNVRHARTHTAHKVSVRASTGCGSPGPPLCLHRTLTNDLESMRLLSRLAFCSCLLLGRELQYVRRHIRTCTRSLRNKAYTHALTRPPALRAPTDAASKPARYTQKDRQADTRAKERTDGRTHTHTHTHTHATMADGDAPPARIAVIGAAWWSQGWHLPQLERNPDAVIAGIMQVSAKQSVLCHV